MVELRFKKKTAGKILESIADRAEEEAVSVCEAAKTVLVQADFQKYREEYVRHQEMLIESLVMADLNFIDPVEYAFNVQKMLTELRVIRNLLGWTISDAGKK